MWALLDLNRRPKDYESFALTAELKALVVVATTWMKISVIHNNFKSLSMLIEADEMQTAFLGGRLDNAFI